jgi:hypothetical protein
MFEKQARQGDLLIKKISEMPANVKESGDKILALGETTGHKHQLMSSEILRVGNNKTVQYLEIVEPDKILHEEHAKIDLHPGKFQVTQQREFDYQAHFEQQGRSFRNVMD